VSALERLDAIDARTTAATPGPWENVSNGIQSDYGIAAVDRGVIAPGWVWREDAGFIAEARQDVPAMATALRAILNLHQPVEQRVGPPICGGCSNELASALHPCATVRIIETELAR
jgi:hypothetical protein